MRIPHMRVPRGCIAQRSFDHGILIVFHVVALWEIPRLNLDDPSGVVTIVPIAKRNEIQAKEFIFGNDHRFYTWLDTRRSDPDEVVLFDHWDRCGAKKKFDQHYNALEAFEPPDNFGRSFNHEVINIAEFAHLVETQKATS